MLRHRLASTAIALAWCITATAALAAAPREIPLSDDLVFPESLTSTPDGTVILGSLGRPVIYRALPGAKTATPWITVTGSGKMSTLGVLADTRRNVLLVCVLREDPAGAPGRHTSLAFFDLKTGAAAASYPLPGDNTLCNDVSIAPDGMLYVSDTLNGRVLRMQPGADDHLEIWLEDAAGLKGIDGLTFLGNTLYGTIIGPGRLVRLPITADGKPGAPVDLTLSQPLMRPDGLREAHGKLYVAEGAAGRISELTLDGDHATVRVLKDGYVTPTGVAPLGDVVWTAESKLLYRSDPKLKGQDPGPFSAFAVPIRP